jgi:hypothetical protein
MILAQQFSPLPKQAHGGNQHGSTVATESTPEISALLSLY